MKEDHSKPLHDVGDFSITDFSWEARDSTHRDSTYRESSCRDSVDSSWRNNTDLGTSFGNGSDLPLDYRDDVLFEMQPREIGHRASRTWSKRTERFRTLVGGNVAGSGDSQLTQNLSPVAPAHPRSAKFFPRKSEPLFGTRLPSTGEAGLDEEGVECTRKTTDSLETPAPTLQRQCIEDIPVSATDSLSRGNSEMFEARKTGDFSRLREAIPSVPVAPSKPASNNGVGKFFFKRLRRPNKETPAQEVDKLADMSDVTALNASSSSQQQENSEGAHPSSVQSPPPEDQLDESLLQYTSAASGSSSKVSGAAYRSVESAAS
jgi:hypothetical protein